MVIYNIIHGWLVPLSYTLRVGPQRPIHDVQWIIVNRWICSIIDWLNCACQSPFCGSFTYSMTTRFSLGLRGTGITRVDNIRAQLGVHTWTGTIKVTIVDLGGNRLTLWVHDDVLTASPSKELPSHEGEASFQQASSYLLHVRQVRPWR